MGKVQNIGTQNFPKQGSYLGRRVEASFHDDIHTAIGGEIVRDDAEAPSLTIIKLDDDRYVLSTECAWRPL